MSAYVFLSSRFSSPSQFSMDLAAKFLEDQDFVVQFLAKSHRLLLQSRLLAEELLTKSGISFHQKGYVCARSYYVYQISLLSV
jgi:hypothetical protein